MSLKKKEWIRLTAEKLLNVWFLENAIAYWDALRGLNTPKVVPQICKYWLDLFVYFFHLKEVSTKPKFF